MIRIERALAVFSGALVLSACATMETGHVGSADHGGEGISYHLPTGYFDLKMFDEDGVLTVTVGGPLMLADGSMPMRTRLLAGGTADNDFTVTVGDNGLLSTVKGTSDGKVTDIATNLAKLVALNAGSEPDVPPFFNRPFRFSDFAAAEAAANEALGAHIAASCPPPRRGVKLTLQCDKFAKLRALAPRGNFIRLSAPGTEDGQMISSVRFARSAEPLAGAPRDALFYHPLAPFQLTLGLANGTVITQTYAVPDKSRIDWVRAPGGVFAKQEYDFTFTNGALTSYKRVARNEAVGLVSLPITVAKSIISAPVELLTARSSTATANATYLAGLSTLATQIETTRASCTKVPAACGTTAYRIMGARTEPPKDTAPTPTTPSTPGSDGQPGTGQGGG